MGPWKNGTDPEITGEYKDPTTNNADLDIGDEINSNKADDEDKGAHITEEEGNLLLNKIISNLILGNNNRDEEVNYNGNQADDGSQYFVNDEEGFDSSFVPDLEYNYEYNSEFQCMTYTGPEFEVGDICDAMKHEHSVNSENISCWEQAKVTDVNDDSYIIQFLRDDDNYTRFIQKSVYRTCMFKAWTHTRKNKWRYFPNDQILNLMVEMYEEMKGTWVLGRVMARMESMNGEIDMAALQTYPDPDNLLDTENSDFPSVSIRSPLIRLPNGNLNF